MEPRHPPASPAQDPQCPRLSPPNHRFLRLIVMYNLLTSATTLAQRGFLPLRCGDGGSRLWQGKGAAAAQGGQCSWRQTCRGAAPQPWRCPGPSLSTPSPPCRAIFPAEPAPAFISPLLPARRRLLSQLPASPSSLSPFSFVFHF